jgi:hypothetical protein
MSLEDLARKAARARGGDRCEICWSADGLEASHRIARSRLGTWHPANIILACFRCHDWFHDEPITARLGGWFVDTDADPMAVPVYLRSSCGDGHPDGSDPDAPAVGRHAITT